MRTWDAASGECIAVIPTGDAWIASLAISPDDACIVTGHPNGTIQFHDAATGTRLAAQQLPTRDVVNALAFDPETKALLLRSVSSLRIIRPPLRPEIVEKDYVLGWRGRRLQPAHREPAPDDPRPPRRRPDDPVAPIGASVLRLRNGLRPSRRRDAAAERRGSGTAPAPALRPHEECVLAMKGVLVCSRATMPSDRECPRENSGRVDVDPVARRSYAWKKPV